MSQTYEVTLIDIPGRVGSKHVQVHDCISSEEAKRTAEAQYGGKATGAGNVYHTKGQNKSSNSGSDLDIDGSVGGVAAVAGLVLVFLFLPWVLMVAGGAAGTWIGQKVTNQTMEEYNQTKNPTKEQHKKTAILLALLLAGGGFGFISGHNISQGWDTSSSDNTEQVAN